MDQPILKIPTATKAKDSEYLSVTKQCRETLRGYADEWGCSPGEIAERCAYLIKVIIENREAFGESLQASAIRALNQEIDTGKRNRDEDDRRTTIYTSKAVGNILRGARSLLSLTTSQMLLTLAPLTRNMLIFDGKSANAYELLKTDPDGVRNTSEYVTTRAVLYDLLHYLTKKLLHDMLQDKATSITAEQVTELRAYIDKRLPLTNYHAVQSGQPLDFNFMGEK